MKPTTIIEQALKHPDFRGALRKSSYNNKTLVTHRLKEFAKVFSNQSSYDAVTRTFSVVPAATSTTQTFPGYGTVLQLASLLANVSSFSGFLSIEKALDQPNMVLHFLDTIGTNVRLGEQSPVFPAVGPTRYDSQSLTPDFREDNLSSPIDAQVQPGTPPTYPPATYNATQFNNLLPVLPYTVRVRFTFQERDATGPVGDPYEVVAFDAGNGTLLFPESWGYFTAGISYGQTTTPSPTNADLNFVFSFTAANLRYANANADTRRLLKVRIEFVYNYIDPAYYPPLNQDNRFVPRLTRAVAINTRPMQLTLELNRQELVAASKSLGVDVQPLIVEQLASIYQKLINRYIVGKYIYRFWDASPTSTTRVDINVITPLGITGAPQLPSQYDQYTPILDKIRGGFEEIRMRLAEKSFIASKITALLVSPRLAGWLARSNMMEQSLWVEEPVNYINDLYGYYMGIPVLRHTDLSRLEAQLESALSPNQGGPLQQGLKVGIGFAVAVLPENNMAPTARGIYLPVTQTATVANFNNPIQEALSLFFQEETEALAPELVVPFAFINLPVG